MTRRPSPNRTLGDQVFRGFYAVISAIAVALIGGVLMLAIGLVQGYRPVVLTSGSMTPTAPVGSIVIARPVDNVEVGDILVMSNEARATVTHRIVELERADSGQVFAVTRGDANSEVDAAPHPIEGSQMVGRWIVPELGNALLWLGSPMIGLVVVGGAVLVLTMTALSHIWGSARTEEDDAVDLGVPAMAGAGPGQKRFAVGIALSLLFGFTGLAWSLYLSVDTIPGNAFSTSDCFDARVGAVQTGTVTSSSNGTTTAAIAAVDPSASFVQWTVRSNSAKPGDAVVLGDLSSPTTIDFIRQTDSPTPPPIVIDWSVVEYACGVTVQRGLAVGNGTNTVDVTIAPVEPTSTFVLGGSVGQAFDLAFEGDDLAVVELVGSDTVRFRTAGPPLSAGRQLGFQVVEFDNAGDVAVEVVGATLGSGVGSATIGLSQPVSTDATMLIATAATTDGGVDIAQRMTRVRLVDSTTVEVQRIAGNAALEVDVQVVHFLDGTTVQSGVVDLNAGEASATVPIAPVDLGRSTVSSTVWVGGASSGGSTDEAATGNVGEGLVTAVFLDAVSIGIDRVPTTSSSSFAWQVVSWGGPGWGDPDSPYRQRIDVDAASVDVPTGYTTPVTIDHAAMVSSGLSAGTGDDLRLWRFDGTSWTELDRVLDEASAWNDPTTTFWFRAQEPVSASTTVSYWMYFGDQTPPAPLDDPSNVWLLVEDFESGLGAFEDRTEGTDWYAADPWSRRMDLTIDAAIVSQPLTDAVVLVSVTDPDLAANAQADGSDLVFTDGGTTVLPHDIERWNPATGELAAWVRVPALDDTADTSISLLYGAADAPARSDQRSTWAGEGIMWNMAGDPVGPAPALDDRGAANVDGLALADTTRVVSPTGFSARLDGSTDRLEAEPFALPDGALTVTAWFNSTAIAGDAVLAAQGDPTAGGVFELAIDDTTTPGSPGVRARLNLDGAVVTASGGAVTPGAWHHVAMVWDQAVLEVFVDGVSVATTPATGDLPASRTIATVLGGDPAGARTLAGDLDHVSVRFEAVSTARIAFEAANLAAPSGTVSAGTPTGGTFLDQGVWNDRRPLAASADLADSDIVDFVLLVQLVDADLGASSQVDGDDLVFTADDGITRLDHHIESWDQATGALTAWVRVPLLSSSVDTELFLYSNNPSAVDQTDPVGVWGVDADLVLSAP